MKSTLALVAMGGVLWCSVGTCADPGTAAKPADCRMGDDVARRLTSHLGAAERVRLELERGVAPEQDAREIAMVLDRCPIAKSMGYSFFRGYNATLDPAWIYIVAVDEKENFSRVRGFPDTHFVEITKAWLAHKRAPTKAEALEIAKTYFALIEGWHPGVVDSRKDLSRALEADATRTKDLERDRAMCRPARPVVTVQAGVARLKITLLDAEATRLECAEVEVSADRGLAVLKREVLIDRLRIEY